MIDNSLTLTTSTRASRAGLIAALWIALAPQVGWSQQVARLPSIQDCNRQPNVAARARCAVDNLELAQRISEAESLVLGIQANLSSPPAFVAGFAQITPQCPDIARRQVEAPMPGCAGPPSINASCRVQLANDKVLRNQVDLSFRALFALSLVNRPDLVDPDQVLRRRLNLALANNVRTQDLLTSVADGRQRRDVRPFYDRGCGLRQAQLAPPGSGFTAASAEELSRESFFRALGTLNSISAYVTRLGVDPVNGRCNSRFPGVNAACLALFDQRRFVLGQTTQLRPSDALVSAPVLEGEQTAFRVAQSQNPTPQFPQLQEVLINLSIVSGPAVREVQPRLYRDFRCNIERTLLNDPSCSFDGTPRPLNVVQ